MSTTFLHHWLCGGRRPWFAEGWRLGLLRQTIVGAGPPWSHARGVVVTLGTDTVLVICGRN